MKKFLKKYGYILLVVVIAAGCYINAPPPYFVTAFYKKFSQQIEAPAIK